MKYLKIDSKKFGTKRKEFRHSFLYSTSRKIGCNSKEILKRRETRRMNPVESRREKYHWPLNAKFKVIRRKIRSRDRYRVDARRFGVGHAEIHPFLVPRERGSSSEARRTSTTPALIELSRSLYQEMERAAPSHHRLWRDSPTTVLRHVDCNIRINFKEMEGFFFLFFPIDLEPIEIVLWITREGEICRDGIKG